MNTASSLLFSRVARAGEMGLPTRRARWTSTTMIIAITAASPANSSG